jgi:aldehyde:ferredoxin oxidoreductase
MTAFGYIRKILHVDLESGHFAIKDLELDSAMAYLGGLGLNALLMKQTYATGDFNNRFYSPKSLS